MFAGHVGVALAIGRAEKRVNIGVFVCASLLLDILLWTFILLGWESATLPADFSRSHQARFIFPYSHGLMACVVWSALAGVAALLWYRRLNGRKVRVACLVGAAVLSHWILDAVVHVPELPLAGPASTKVGLGLWKSMPVALTVEGLLVTLGIGMFVPGASLSRGRKTGLCSLCVVILAFTIAGMTIAPPPPSVSVMAGGALATLIVVCAVACWLGHLRNQKQG
jgi:hypothetical protein